MNQRPLFLAAVFFLLGILYRGRGEPGILFIAAAFLIWNIFLRWKRRGWRQGVFYLAFFFAFLCGSCRMEEETEYRNRYEPFLQDGKEMAVQGTIYKKEAGSKSNRYYLKHCYLSMEGKSVPCNRILAYLDTDHLSIGTTIIIKGNLKTLSQARNEGNFDEKNFYQSQKIDFKFYGEEARVVTGEEHWLWEVLYEKKEEMKQVYLEILGEKNAGILSTMALGDRELLSDEIKDIYQSAGISHILAISGLHISMIGMGMYRLLQKCGLPPILKTALSTGLMAGFAVLVGAGVSTKRAVLMFFMLLLGNLIGRSYDSLTALGLAAILLLWENPFVWEYSGFQLSFLAVLGVNAGGWILKCCEEKQDTLRKELFHGRVDTAKIKRKWKRQLVVSMSIQTFTIPVIAWCYYELPVYGIIVNLLILPTAGILLSLGIAGGILGCIHPVFGWLPLKGAGVLLQYYENVSCFFLNLPKSIWITGKPSMSRILFYYGVVFLLLLVIFYMGRIGKSVSFVVFLCVLSHALQAKTPQSQIKVLDVGQGDGIYIESEKGSSFFVDGGSVDISEVGKYRILPFLKAQGKEQVDIWFVSHCDADHISGLMEILESGYPVGRLVFSEYVVRDEAFETLRELAEEKGCKVTYLEKGERISDGSLSFQALYPFGGEIAKRNVQEEGETEGDRNARSLVLLLEAEDFRGLLTGDIGKEQEKELQAMELGEIDWYKAAHHGSKESNSRELLEKLKPKTATISCGIDNSYGHPGAEAVENMETAGAVIFETTECGQITILPKEGEITAFIKKKQ